MLLMSLKQNQKIVIISFLVQILSSLNFGHGHILMTLNQFESHGKIGWFCISNENDDVIIQF